MRNSETPLGLGITLILNREALKSFSSLTVPEQQNFIENAHSFTTNDEMKKYVSTLIKNEENNE